MGVESSMLREVLADTSGDATELTTRSDLSGAQQQRNWSLLALHFPFHRNQRSNMETRDSTRVQFLDNYDVSSYQELDLPSLNCIILLTVILNVLWHTAQ